MSKIQKYYFIYKTTCKITNKYYVGMHITENIEDNYLGSGKRLHYSINKYGKQNHIREILEFLPDKKSLIEREAAIVNKTMLDDYLCMNLTYGGNGNWAYLNSNSDIQRNKCKKANIKMKWLRENDPEWVKHKSLCISIGNKLTYNNGRIPNPPDWTGKKHTKITKLKMHNTHEQNKHQQGEKNSQYGTRWITNGKENKKIHKDNTIPDGWKLGRKMRL